MDDRGAGRGQSLVQVLPERAHRVGAQDLSFETGSICAQVDRQDVAVETNAVNAVAIVGVLSLRLNLSGLVGGSL
jgi:hypothetical protein